ncbi:MAG: glycosyltransferase family 2 protein, partial [Candidatus Omnitrophica bacterium]|nr:glycosyltransferase family 2 protein [Candidatus Omnitrophota bacterium]
FCYLLPNTYSYPSTLTLSLVRAGYSLNYVPIEVRTRLGRSKISVLRDGVRFLLIMLKVIMLFAPLRVFLPISLFCLVTGITYGGYMILTVNHFTPATLLLLMTSLLTFLMGLISEQIAQLRLIWIDRVPDPDSSIKEPR